MYNIDYEKLIERMKNYTPEECVELAIKAGIFDREGNLLPPYNGEPKGERHE